MDEGVPSEFDISWQALRSSISENGRSPAAHNAGVWAVDILRSYLGESWMSRAFERDRDLALRVFHAASHLIAFADLVELASRVSLLSGVPKLASVRTQLQQDLRSEAWLHAQLQLEVAALARWHGAEVRIEDSAIDGMPPVDVEFRLPSTGTTRVETFVLLMDEAMRADMGYDDEVGFKVMQLQCRYDITISGEAAGTPRPSGHGASARGVGKRRATSQRTGHCHRSDEEGLVSNWPQPD